MAETLGFTVKIDGVEKSITSLKDLKLATKQAKDEQVAALAAYGESSKEFQAASAKVAGLKDKMEDLGDSAKNVKGEGIEPLQNSLSAMGEGLRNADFGKFKAGLQGVGQAMSAIPIFLLIEGIKLLIENFDAVLAFSKDLFNMVSEDEKAVRQLTRELEKQKEVTATLSKELSRELEIMEAQGKSHAEITAKKKELIATQIDEAIATAKLNMAKAREVMNNDSLYESYLRLNAQALRKIGLDEKAEEIEKLIAINKAERNKENIQAVKDSMELIKDLQTKSQVETIKLDKETHDNWKKLQDEKRQRYLDDLTWKHQKMLEEQAWELQAEKDLAAQKTQVKQEEFDASAWLFTLKAEQAEKEFEHEKELAAQQKDAKVEAAQTAFNAAEALSQLGGQIALNRAKGNAQKELAIRKTMFNVDKAFNVARAVMDGIRSVQAALTIPPPAGQILAVANGVLAAANVAKILATKFDGGSVGSTDTGGGAVSTAIPTNPNQTIPNVPAPQAQPTMQFDEFGKRIGPLRAEVVETQSREVSKRIDKYNQQSEY